MASNDPSNVLSVLGHRARYAALRTLVDAGAEGLSAGELARRLEVAPSNLSFHMAALTNVGLATSERRGQSVIYRAEPGSIDVLLQTLALDLSAAGRPSPE